MKELEGGSETLTIMKRSEKLQSLLLCWLSVDAYLRLFIFFRYFDYSSDVQARKEGKSVR